MVVFALKVGPYCSYERGCDGPFLADGLLGQCAVYRLGEPHVGGGLGMFVYVHSWRYYHV